MEAEEVLKRKGWRSMYKGKTGRGRERGREIGGKKSGKRERRTKDKKRNKRCNKKYYTKSSIPQPCM